MFKINIVLVSNAATLQICQHMGILTTQKEGWVEGLVSSLKTAGVNIYFIFPHRINSELISGEIDGLHYYGYPKTKKQDWEYEEIHKKYFITIYKKISKIDVIHIMGTEMGHTLSAVEAAEEYGLIDKTVISIQGMTSIYARHYLANLPQKIVTKNTLRDIIKKDNIRRAQKRFEVRGKYEVNALSKVRHVIGRTDWDKACTYFINPMAQYHFCNETLRSSFYEGSWDYTQCEPHTIFMSQGNYPIKGLHYAIESLAEVKKYYPDVKLRITGESPLTNSVLIRQKRGTYSNYLEELIRGYQLERNIKFLGVLDAEEMKKEYLRANVFVSASSIENSPNSVGEAMILGTPVVSSDVGGVKNLLIHNEEGFVYQSDAPYMLAFYVMTLFENISKANEFSTAAKKHASITHSVSENRKQMIRIYKEIADEGLV